MTPENQAKLTELQSELLELMLIPMITQELNRRKEQLRVEIRLLLNRNRVESFLIGHGLDPERYSVEGGDDDHLALLDRVTNQRYLVSTSLSREEVHAALVAQTPN